MPRFFLENPTIKGSKLKQIGQLSCKPLYKCEKSGTFWLLRLTTDFNRELVQYFPQNEKIDPNKCYPVPKEWLGEPQVIGVNEQTLSDLKNSLALNYRKAIKKIIEDGDIIVLLNEKQQSIGQITTDKDLKINIKLFESN